MALLQLQAQLDHDGMVPPVRVNFDQFGNLYIYQDGQEILIDVKNVPQFVAFVQGGE